MEECPLNIPRSRPAAQPANHIYSPAVPITPNRTQLGPGSNGSRHLGLPDQLPPSPHSQSTSYHLGSGFVSANRGRRSPHSARASPKSPSLHSKRSVPYLRHRPPSDSAFSPRRFTPRNSPRKLRSVASTPMLRSSASRRTLRPRNSRLDLLDKSQITSFPSMPAKARGAETESFNISGNNSGIPESPTGFGTDIIDNYIPYPFDNQRPKIDDVEHQTEPPNDTNWIDTVWRKLRWRWRLQGLIHY